MLWSVIESSPPFSFVATGKRPQFTPGALFLTVAFLLLCLAPGPARAQEVNTQTGDISFSGPALATLLKAVESVDTSPDITISIVGKDPSEMPKLDQFFHYAGLSPKNP